MISVEEKMAVKYDLHVNHPNTCFEILGFDILLDKDLRPWLLEVNTVPDLGANSPLDMKLKTSIVEDTLHMIGISLFNILSQNKKNASNLKTKSNLIINCNGVSS